MPWLHRFIGNNPLYLAIRKPTGVFSRRSKKLLDERYAEGVGGRNDFVDRFVAAKEKYPDQVTERKITMWILQNLVAGSDTTVCVSPCTQRDLADPRYDRHASSARHCTISIAIPIYLLDCARSLKTLE